MSPKIRLRIDVNEIEIEGDKKFIEKHLESFTDNYFNIKTIETKQDIAKLHGKTIVTQGKSKKSLSPAEFVRQKNPKGGTEQLIVLAKYLEDLESLSEFSIKDINRVAKTARIGKIDNSYYSVAVKQGLLNKIKHGRYQITLTGEDKVLAMSSPTK